MNRAYPPRDLCPSRCISCTAPRGCQSTVPEWPPPPVRDPNAFESAPRGERVYVVVTLSLIALPVLGMLAHVVLGWQW